MRASAVFEAEQQTKLSSGPPAKMSERYTVSGSSFQTTINGVYRKSSNTANGHPYYQKGSGPSMRVMYWSPGHGGKWLIGDSIGQGAKIRADLPGGSAPRYGPPREGGWNAFNNGWAREPSLRVGPTPGPHMNVMPHISSTECTNAVQLCTCT